MLCQTIVLHSETQCLFRQICFRCSIWNSYACNFFVFGHWGVVIASAFAVCHNRHQLCAYAPSLALSTNVIKWDRRPTDDTTPALAVDCAFRRTTFACPYYE